jgi:hypothetical protein
MTKEEKKVRARLENLVMAGGSSMELMAGKCSFEVLAEIPKYFMLASLKDKRPPGKIVFQTLTEGTSVMMYTSYTNKKPDRANCMQEYSIHKVPLTINLKTAKQGREEIFDHDVLYLGIDCDVDTKITLNISFKYDGNKIEKAPAAKKKTAELLL